MQAHGNGHEHIEINARENLDSTATVPASTGCYVNTVFTDVGCGFPDWLQFSVHYSLMEGGDEG